MPENPSIVIDAVLDEKQTFGKLEVQNLTIYRYAMLEKVGSPFLDLDKEFTLQNLASSIFIMTSSKEQIKAVANDLAKLNEAALDFIDENLEIHDIAGITSAIIAKLQAISKAAPTGDGPSDAKKN